MGFKETVAHPHSLSLSPLLFAVAKDVNSNEARDGPPSEMLYADSLILYGTNNSATW